MSMREKFNEFKEEIKENFDKDKLVLLEMSVSNVSELIQSGYFYRRVESFFFVNEFSIAETRKFFTDECGSLTGSVVGELLYDSPEETISGYIERLKVESVKYYLWIELIEFVCMLKGQGINYN